VKEVVTSGEIKSEMTESTYSPYDLILLAQAIEAEAGYSYCSDEWQQAVGCVILNRVKDSRYADSIHDVLYEVIAGQKQYACVWNGMLNNQPSTKAFNNARLVLSGIVTIPENIIFQAEYKQGVGVWKKIGNTYFCYG
jgi:spore germination cell wall hydrolase CwlJ-like protein